MIESVTAVSAAGQSVGSVSGMPPDEPAAFDVHQFEQAYQSVEPGVTDSPASMEASTGVSGFKQALDSIRDLNGSLRSLGMDSLQVSAGAENLTPGLMLDMTVRAQEFLFQSQLTATIANKTSDGITQLFRQQG